MGATRRTAPHSTFRNVALILSAISATLFLLCVGAVVRGGGHAQDFAWTYDRADGRLVINRVHPNGPADGRLQAGEKRLVWNADRSIMRVGAAPFGRDLRRDAIYTP